MSANRPTYKDVGTSESEQETFEVSSKDGLIDKLKGKGVIHVPSNGIPAIPQIRFYSDKPGSKRKPPREFFSGYQMCDHLDKPGGTLSEPGTLDEPNGILKRLISTAASGKFENLVRSPERIHASASHALELASMVAAFGDQNPSTPPLSHAIRACPDGCRFGN